MQHWRNQRRGNNSSNWYVAKIIFDINSQTNFNNLNEKLFTFVANVYLKKVPDHMSVVEGERLQIHCKAFGTDPQITWTIGEYNLVICTN